MLVDDFHDTDGVMPVHNLAEYSDNCSKASGALQQYCKDKPALDANNTITDFTEANGITDSFKIKEKITGKTDDNVAKVVEITV